GHAVTQRRGGIEPGKPDDPGKLPRLVDEGLKCLSRPTHAAAVESIRTTEGGYHNRPVLRQFADALVVRTKLHSQGNESWVLLAGSGEPSHTNPIDDGRAFVGRVSRVKGLKPHGRPLLAGSIGYVYVKHPRDILTPCCRIPLSIYRSDDCLLNCLVGVLE